jgi:hypothetical protein
MLQIVSYGMLHGICFPVVYCVDMGYEIFHALMSTPCLGCDIAYEVIT